MNANQQVKQNNWWIQPVGIGALGFIAGWAMFGLVFAMIIGAAIMLGMGLGMRPKK